MRKGIAFVILSFLILTFSTSWAQQEITFPYSLSKKDWIIGSVSILTEVSSVTLGKQNDHNLTLPEIEKLNRQNINKFDRTATYHWSIAAQQFSDVPSHIMPWLPLALVIPPIKNKKLNQAFTLGAMYLEVSLLTTGITGTTKSLVGRVRPYLYNSSFTPQERFDLQKDGPTATTSFFSGHSSNTFAFAIFLSKTFTDIYGKTVWSKLVWGTTLTFATATAYARVKGGVHFPSDVIVGSLVGGAIGYFIPVLHKVKPEKLSLQVLPGSFYVTYKL